MTDIVEISSGCSSKIDQPKRVGASIQKVKCTSKMDDEK